MLAKALLMSFCRTSASIFMRTTSCHFACDETCLVAESLVSTLRVRYRLPSRIRSGTTATTMPTIIFFPNKVKSCNRIASPSRYPSGYRGSVGYSSESELDRQLDLSRDALKGCGGARRRDRSVGGTCSDVRNKCSAGRGRGWSGRGRVIELRRIEQVEKFAADLQRFRFGHLEILEDREIHVLGPRTLKDIASRVAPLPVRQRTGQWNAHKRSGVEPFVDIAFLRRQRSVAVAGHELGPRRKTVAHSVGRSHGKRQTVEVLQNGVHLPSLHPRVQLAANFEGQLVSRAGHESVRNVQVRISVVSSEIIGICKGSPGAARIFVQSMAVGVGGKEAQTTSPSFGCDLHRVVARDLIGLQLEDLGEERVRTIHRDIRCPRRSRIDVFKIIEMKSAGSDVSDRDCG